MTTVIDLEPFFTVEAIKAAYAKYKESKTDRYKPDQIRIPMGADGVTWKNFERNLDHNARNISRRVLNGTYQFYPFREKNVQKPNGGERVLSIAGVRDVLVQHQLYEALYKSAEAMFAQPGLDQISFAYRKGKSAPCAALHIWQAYRRSGYGYALDADIQKFFDTLDHERLMALVDNWIGRDTIAGKLLWRYIRTDRVPYDKYPHDPDWKKFFMTKKPNREHRLRGVPQGGVLSGMLANLYLHEFDRWVVKDLGRQFDLRYFRYADDFVILTRCEADSRELYEPVASKLRDPMLLEIHPLRETADSKTRISVIARGDLEFVGFHFMEDSVRAKRENIQRFKKRFLIALDQEHTLKGSPQPWTRRLRQTIRWCVNPKITGPEPEICANCGLPKERQRSWVAFFASVVSDVDQLRQLDRWMRQRICKHFWDKYGVRLDRQNLRKAGMKTLVGQYYRVRQIQNNLCKCEHDSTPT